MEDIILAMWFYLAGQGMGKNLSDYLGCFSDLTIYWNTSSVHFDNSRNKCKGVCKSKNYRYAGTKNKVICWCGNILKLTRRNEAECSIHCPEGQDGSCGGVHHIQVYDLWPCRNGASCNGFKCEDINGTEYKCLCSRGWQGKNCDKNITEPPSTTTTTTTAATTTTKLTTLIQNVNISSTIVGNDSELETNESTTPTIDNTDDTVFYKSNWFTILVIVVAITASGNGVCLLVWCLQKNKHNEMESENNEVESAVNTDSGNKACFEMEKRQIEEIRCSTDIEEDLYNCIEDSNMSIYENVDSANHCVQDAGYDSDIYDDTANI